MKRLFEFILIVLSSIQALHAMEAPLGAQELQQHLLLSADIGDCPEIETSIQLGADINAIGNATKCESMDWTSLMFAARQEHRYTKVLGGDKLKACRTLVRAGADINARAGRFGWTALMVAAGKGNLPVCRILIENGADLNIVDSEGRTLWDWAVESDQFEVCELLLQSSIDLKCANLVKFIEKNDVETCFQLIQRGVCAKGYLSLAIDKHASPALIQLLLENGASITEKPCYERRFENQNALHIAAYSKSEQLCQMLVKSHRKFNSGFIVGLLCLKKMKEAGNPCAALLYRERKILLVPLLIDYYIPLKKLLSTEDGQGKRSFDYLPLDCLNPDLADKYPLEELTNGGWSYCSIQ